MAIPARESIYLPLLRVIEDAGGELRPQEVIARLERFFPALTREDKEERHARTGERIWPNTVRWARKDLVQWGYLDGSIRGMWRITPLGRQHLLENWANWRPRYSTGRERTAPASSATPEDQPQRSSTSSATPQVNERQTRATPSRLHEQLKHMLYEIGEIMGYDCHMEFRESLHVYDVVWKDVPTAPRPSRVFEVQDRGHLSDALVKLQHAKDVWGSSLFLVVTGERDRRRVDQLLGPLLSGTFHRLARGLTVLQPEDVEELHRTLGRHRDLVRKLLPE